jgi:hypothetical protein
MALVTTDKIEPKPLSGWSFRTQDFVMQNGNPDLRGQIVELGNDTAFVHFPVFNDGRWIPYRELTIDHEATQFHRAKMAKARADELQAAFPKTGPVPPAEDEEYRFTDKVEHYNGHPSGVECQEIIRECKDPMVAFAMKHLWRSQWGNKPGAPKGLDLKKAIEYLQIELAREEGQKRL